MDYVQTDWSEHPSEAETEYRMKGYMRTAGTAFIIPPPEEELLEAFESSHLGTELTVGARALCKHHARMTDHPVWQRPTGTMQQKNATASFHARDMLSKATWKNVHYLPHQQLVYEIRDKTGYGMRWTLMQDAPPKFRGYVEAQAPR